MGCVFFRPHLSQPIPALTSLWVVTLGHFLVRRPAHKIFDVLFDDEVQLFVREAVVLDQHPIYLVYDRLGVFRLSFRGILG